MNKTHYDVISPIDGKVVTTKAYTKEKDLQERIEKSKYAQSKWHNTSIEERITICQNFLDEIIKQGNEIGEQITRQMGRPIEFAKTEVLGVKERGDYLLSVAKESLDDIKIDDKRYMRKSPLGIILVIAPWNYPLLTAINVIIPAILAGNSVLLKHSSQTPLCGEQIKHAFDKAGLPNDVLQTLHLTHDLTTKLIGCSDIAHVSFTGSVKGGRQIQQAIGSRFINSTLELGGKDAAYVREDAILSSTISALVDGVFFNSGQSCCGIERIYVQRSRYAEFIDNFITQTYGYILGNPLEKKTTLGPVVNNTAATLVREQIANAVSNGATALIDESKFPLANNNTPYLAPQVLINVNHQMALMQEENFGPVVGIMPVDNDEQALDLINDCRFGLTASIWTQDIEIAKSLGDKAQVGTWFMNRCDYVDPALAWTGIKETGKGLSVSKLCFDTLTKIKSYHLQT
jgi:acyl-CoA reductase-like NAD-dependent aldehyde dehydrogenase